MTLPTPETLELLARLALIIAGFTIYALLAARWQRSARRDSERLFEQADLGLTGLRELAESVAALEVRLGALAAHVEAGLQAPASPVPAAAPRSYEIAIRLARNGASAADLEASCGLTAREAALLTRLHGIRKTPAVVRSITHSGPARLQTGTDAADTSS